MGIDKFLKQINGFMNDYASATAPTVLMYSTGMEGTELYSWVTIHYVIIIIYYLCDSSG